MSDFPVDVFFNDTTLTDTVTYSGSTFEAHFLNEYDAMTMFQIQIESAAPAMLCRNEDIAGIAHDSKLSVGGTDYKVIEIRPYTGATVLRLAYD